MRKFFFTFSFDFNFSEFLENVAILVFNKKICFEIEFFDSVKNIAQELQRETFISGVFLMKMNLNNFRYHIYISVRFV